MSRLSRLPLISFGYYYVLLRARKGRRLLTSQSDVAAFLRILTATLRRHGVCLHGGYVGETEAHLALRMGEKSVSTFTGTLCHNYTLLFNGSHRTSGSLFRPHTRVLLIQQPPWLIPLVHYIHQLADRRAPESCQMSGWWSSDAAYRRRDRMNGLVTSYVLRSVSHSRSRQKQDEAYARRFGEALDPSVAQRFLKGSPQDPRILGDDKFLSDVWHQAGQRPARRRKMDAPNDELIRRTLEEAIRRFRGLCEAAVEPRKAAAWSKALTLANVCAMSRKCPLPMIRALCMSYLLEHHLATRLQAAHFFGCLPESLSAGCRLRHERSFCQWFNQPYSILFEPGRDRLAAVMTRASPRGTVGDETGAQSEESGEESRKDRVLQGVALGGDASTAPGAPFAGHSSSAVLHYSVKSVSVPRKVSETADPRWNRTQAIWGTLKWCAPSRPQACLRSHVAARRICFGDGRIASSKGRDSG